MKDIVNYILKYYIKKYRYVAPIILFVIFLRINYSQYPMGVWNNYSFTCLVVFIFSIWISYGFFEFEDKTQQYLAILHSKSEIRFYMSKIAANLIFLIPLDVIVVLLPVISKLFDRRITIGELVAALALHLLSSLIAISVTSIVLSGIIKDKSYCIMILFSLIVLTAAKTGIISSMPYFSFLKWILPPVDILNSELNSLGEQSVYHIDIKFLVNILYELIYSTILLAFYLKITIKRLL